MIPCLRKFYKELHLMYILLWFRTVYCQFKSSNELMFEKPTKASVCKNDAN